jgi:hypothetical protein
MAKTHQFTACSKAEVLLLLDLAREHEPHVHLSFREVGDVLQIYLEADSTELSDYLRFMLARLRDQQHRIETTYQA